jgi:hypothetical protein
MANGLSAKRFGYPESINAGLPPDTKTRNVLDFLYLVNSFGHLTANLTGNSTEFGDQIRYEIPNFMFHLHHAVE